MIAVAKLLSYQDLQKTKLSQSFLITLCKLVLDKEHLITIFITKLKILH